MNSTNTFRRMAVVLAAAAGLLQMAPAVADVAASEGWARASVPGAKTGVGYLVLTNKGEEVAKLIALTTTVCDRLMIHRSTVDAQGVARMWPVAKLEIEPGETVRFDPNGLHLMFDDLKVPLVAGQKVPVRMVFDGLPQVTVQLEVRPLVPEKATDHSQH
jgi:periplasmic copper chaperone A